MRWAARRMSSRMNAGLTRPRRFARSSTVCAPSARPRELGKDETAGPEDPPWARVSCPGMSEIVFVVEEAPEGGFIARAIGASIFTEADTLGELHDRARDAVRCHFDEGKAPKLIRLHYVRDEVIAA